MKNTFNLNNLDCRLANTNSPFNRAKAHVLIKDSAREAGALHALHHLEALDKPQRLEHLVWLAEYQGQYIGWLTLEAHITEDDENAYLTIAPYSLYVDQQFREKGVAARIIEKVAFDVAFLITLELNYRSFKQFHLEKGIEAEVLSLYLEFEAKGDADTEQYFINKISHAVLNELEKQTDDLPYFVRTESEVF